MSRKNKKRNPIKMRVFGLVARALAPAYIRAVLVKKNTLRSRIVRRIWHAL